MDDYLAGDRNGTTELQLFNLAVGRYTAYVYAWYPPNSFGADHSEITVVEFTTGSFQTVRTDYGAGWAGQALGITYAKTDFEVIAPNGVLLFRLESIGSGEDSPVSVLNGIQIVPIPAPGISALVCAGAGWLSVRRRR